MAKLQSRRRNPDHVLVTGGCGFVGSHLIEYLLEQDCARIWSVCRNPPRRRDPRVRALSHDLAHPLASAEGLPKRLDLVFHCASPPSGSAPADLQAANATGTLELLEYAERAGARRFVYVSSGGVSGYGRQPIPETAAPAPGTPYLEAKLAGEAAVLAHRGRVEATVVRLFFPYGPGQRHGLVPLLCERLRKGQPIVVGPGGAPRLNPIHVRDAVRLIHSAAVADTCEPLINVAGSEITSVRGLSRELARGMALRPRYRRDAAHALHLVGATELLHSRHGRDRIPLAAGLAELVHPPSAD
jgi:nucleoside-diphosphate-sugar epimerase